MDFCLKSNGFATGGTREKEKTGESIICAEYGGLSKMDEVLSVK